MLLQQEFVLSISSPGGTAPFLYILVRYMSEDREKISIEAFKYSVEPTGDSSWIECLKTKSRDIKDFWSNPRRKHQLQQPMFSSEPRCSTHGLSTSAWELLCHSKSQKYSRASPYPKISLILLELVLVEGQAVWSATLMSSLANYPAISVSLPPTCTKREGAAGREGGSINSVNQNISTHELSGFTFMSSI